MIKGFSFSTNNILLAILRIYNKKSSLSATNNCLNTRQLFFFVNYFKNNVNKTCLLNICV